MTHLQSLQQQLVKVLDLPQDAVDFLSGVWTLSQFFDDVADGDAVARPDLDAAVWFAFVGMTVNPFFARNWAALNPVMATQVLKWQASDAAERAGARDARSYVWRAGFYDLVLAVTCLCHGREKATEMASAALCLYGETLDEYMGEAHA